MADLKQIYQAPTQEIAEHNLDHLEEKWGYKYTASISSWRNNWLELSAYFKYPPELRKMIYTTNRDRKIAVARGAVFAQQKS